MKVTKRFDNYPAGHRQHTHSGHCSFVHGHQWHFDLTFTSTERDSDGFVIDFGRMQYIKDALAHQFDHTLLINEDDPMRSVFESMHTMKLADVRFMHGVSAEALAEWVIQHIGALVSSRTNNRVALQAVTVWEDNKNCATLEQ